MMNENENKKCPIYDSDLLQNRNYYDITTLEQNILNLRLKIILRTQKLTPDFCVKYILSEEYAFFDNEMYICEGDVLSAQKHISEDDLQQSWIKYNNEKNKK